MWAPVAFGAGSASYFGLKVEPLLDFAMILALAALAGAIFARAWGGSRRLVVATSLIAFAAAGFAGAAIKAHAVAAPRIPAGYGVGLVEGWVVDVSSPSDGKGRLLIRPTRIAHLGEGKLPAFVRVTVAPDRVVGPGEAVRLTAVLHPPPRPAAPGAYDFARDAWFERIGGVGAAVKQPELIVLPPAPLLLKPQIAVNKLRWRLASRLADDVASAAPGAGPGAAGLVVAVTTSHAAWLPETSAQDLRGSGLAHMLAIAGLHTAALSGFVFAALRLGIAAWPWAAVRVSGKKVAALGGLIAVLCYLTVSGAHPPARRAAITASVAFVAILLDRRAISLRSLSLAALIVLALQPEAVIQPGFQMSFCATGALVAMAELWPHRPRLKTGPWVIRAVQRARDVVIALFMVSFVAGAATGPFAIQHFNRVANYGVAANLTADFIASAVMMPAVGLSALGEALGVPRSLLWPVLNIAGWAARGILEIGHACSTAPFAQVSTPAAPSIAMLAAFLGMLFAILWKGSFRWLGAPFAFAVIIWPRPPSPVAWIANDGNAAAIAHAGKVIALKPGKRAYAVELWAARRGYALPTDPEAALEAFFACNRHGCAPAPATIPAIGAWWTHRVPPPEVFEALCGVSSVVIMRAEVDAPAACARTTVLKQSDFERLGAAELYAQPTGGIRISWAEPLRGDRLWTRKSEVNDSGE